MLVAREGEGPGLGRDEVLSEREAPWPWAWRENCSSFLQLMTRGGSSWDAGKLTHGPAVELAEGRPGPAA